jgi:dihydroorotate dehydrogenase
MLAAGFDKDAEAVGGFFALGFSAVEVGTVTPRPQPGNPAPRLFRLPEARALINRMGFNNHGMEAMAGRLEALRCRPGPVGVNIGKNKETPLERAAEDYLAAAGRLGPLADYLVVNASSPNTPGLRKLQEPEQLRALLAAVKGRLLRNAAGKPLLLKIAPDLEPDAVDAVVDVAVESGLSGLICTNTTLARPVQGRRAEEPGGLSGAPLAPLALATLRRASARAHGRLALWASGGVFTAEDVLERLRAGADLVQVYTALVYEGPGFVPRLLRDLTQRLRAEGAQSLHDYVKSA